MIVDNLLQARECEGCPIRVGMIGAGFMAQRIANTIVAGVPGMMVVGVYGRRIERAIHVCSYAALEDALVATTQDDLEDAVRAGRPVVTDDPSFFAGRTRSKLWWT